jgi:hypothetical protein
MSKLLDEFVNLIQSRPNYAARGFININCPACGDKRKRGGFAVTGTGGFRYSCYNGGCDYNTRPTGWEEGNGLGGRVKQLFEMLGGDVRRLPAKDLLRKGKAVYDKSGAMVGREKRLEIASRFPPVVLPKGSVLLEEAAETNADAEEVLGYLFERSPLYLNDEFPFLWTPRYPQHLIIPFMHFDGKVVGYLGRHINKADGADRFIQRAPADYMFNQHLLSGGENKYTFVMESPMDAILLRGVATRSNRITERQINLLKVSNKEPILIPDQMGDESISYYQTAKEHGWKIAVPEWPFKDAGEAIQKMGLLSTIETLTTSMTTNYMQVRGRLGILTNE